MDSRFAFSQFAGTSVHLGVCGSISAYKAVELMRLFQALNMRPTVTLTEAGQRFITPLTFEALGAEKVYTEMFESNSPDIFGHLLPGAEADAFVIAPASATTLARLATGLASEILSAQCLAFAGTVVLAPAMNPRMWAHPATKSNIATLKSRGAIVVEPNCGLVACGESGQGKLAKVEDIFLATLKALSPQDLAGKKVMLTIGPTREPWDGVRFWSNPSTGLMGSSLALAAWLRGAEVHAIVGAGVAPLPCGITSYAVQTASEMYEQAKTLWNAMDIGVFTAAVADFSPVSVGANKFKKENQQDGFSVEFRANRDILGELGNGKTPRQKVLGFAAETENLEEQVARKLQRKNADLLAGNIVGKAGAGFGSAMNSVYVLDKHGKFANLPNLSKPDLAWRLLDWLLTL